MSQPTGCEQPALNVRTTLIALVLVLAPVSRFLVIVDDREGGDYALHTVIFAVDVALVALVVVQVRHMRTALRSWRNHLAALAALILAGLLVPGFVAHPSDRGVAAILRLVGVACLATALPQLDGLARRVVLTTAGGVAAASGTVAIAQRFIEGPVGLSALGESRAAVQDIVGGTAPFGLFVHPYVQAGWAVVCGLGFAALILRPLAGAPPRWLTVLAVAPIGLTMTRSAVLGAASALVFVIALALRRSTRASALFALALVVATGTGFAWNARAWVGRSEQTFASSSPSNLRGALFLQGQGLLSRDPVLGVGPGNYVLALTKRPDLVRLHPQTPRPVHNVPYLLVVEGGLVALPGVAVLIAGLLLQAAKGGLAGCAVLGAVAPFLLLDHFVWSFPQGIVLGGLVLGVLDLCASEAPAAIVG